MQSTAVNITTQGYELHPIEPKTFSLVLVFKSCNKLLYLRKSNYFVSTLHFSLLFHL
jgi:hypothetical protein